MFVYEIVRVELIAVSAAEAVGEARPSGSMNACDCLEAVASARANEGTEVDGAAGG